MAYDYTPVPSYTAPTEGNMQQAATEIANWLRTKGDGKDVRESLAQAVQLFGDVAAQFINQSEGLKGKFDSAIAGANANSEVAASHSSTTTGKSYISLPDRLDAIDAEQVSHENELAAARQSYGNLGGREDAQDNWIKDVQNSISDTGWLTDGVTFGQYVTANDFRYRIIKIGSFQQMIFEGSFALKAALQSETYKNWGGQDTYLFKLPAGYAALNNGAVQYFIGTGHKANTQDMIYRQYNGDGVISCGAVKDFSLTDGYISDVSGSIFLTEAVS